MSTLTVDTIRILLVDDHAMFRDGLARMLEKEADFTVAAQAGSATEGLGAVTESRANMVLLDVDLGGERALDFVRGARGAGFEGQILVVTAGMSDQEAVQLVQAGVSGILHKHHSTEELCNSIRQIANGEVCIEQAYLAPLFRAVDRTRAPRRANLTDRDKTVLRGILQGLSNREIAAKLQISEGAVKASVRHVCEKLSVRTRSQLVKVALEQYKDQL
ncbi:MAG TPA: response regulator transcription factor [Bryobacteraceae bacterium]|nr:response regulator transcription factor [Bryobacteraceae bacterium]